MVNIKNEITQEAMVPGATVIIFVTVNDVHLQSLASFHTFPLSSMSLMKRWHGDGTKLAG
jgi:hypothetical protein